MAKEYIEESESVALNNGFGESYDHEAATLEAIHDAGVEEGIQKGIEKKTKEMIKAMYQNGITDIDKIVEISQLSKEEVKEILNEN